MQYLPAERRFFERSAREVAPDLLGYWLIRRTTQGWVGGPIVETEAYISDDAACHAACGPTARNGVMFGPPGHSYVYFIYGCHYCVNAVCMPAGTGEAVLIRAIEPRLGSEIMRMHRPVRTDQLTNGPGKLCAAMKITGELNGADLCDAASELQIVRVANGAEGLGGVVNTTRIGITKAASLPLRFYLQGSGFVSRR